MEKIRAFIAIEVTEEIRREIKELQDELKSLTPSQTISWARPPAIHLTLKFLGDIDVASVEKIADALTQAAGTMDCFDIKLTGAGSFPNSENPRVIWAGVNPEEQLRLINREIEERMSGLGFEREGKEFHPHLTIARVKTREDSKKISKALKELKREASGSFTAEELILFKSELKGSGAVHTVIKRARFKAPRKTQ